MEFLPDGQDSEVVDKIISLGKSLGGQCQWGGAGAKVHERPHQ